MQRMLDAFGDLPELAGDGGSLIRLYHGQSGRDPDGSAAAASADARGPAGRQGVAAQPRRRHRRLVGAGHRRRAGPTGLRHASLPWRPPVPRRRHRRGLHGLGRDRRSASWPPSSRSTTPQSTTSSGPSRRTPRSGRRCRSPTSSGPTRPCSNDAADPGDDELRRTLLGEALAFYRRAGIAERVAEVEAALGAGTRVPSPSSRPGSSAARGRSGRSPGAGARRCSPR